MAASLYVNGDYTGDIDSVKGGIARQLGQYLYLPARQRDFGQSSVAGHDPLRRHSQQRPDQEQVQQNFAAGVGERYFLLFDVSALTGVARAYIMLTTSMYDSYSYLFNRPTFISLDPTSNPGTIAIKGMVSGINGAEAPLARPTHAGYHGHRHRLLGRPRASCSLRSGTVIALEKGPDSDLFFLELRSDRHAHARAHRTDGASAGRAGR